jgi:LysM repeat protein
MDNNPIWFNDVLGDVANGDGKNKQPTHTVQSGDNLTKIAKKYNTTVDEIAKRNGIKDVNKIKVGQVLKVGPVPTQNTKSNAIKENSETNTSDNKTERPDLGVLGNQIRNRAGSEYSKDMFENYWQSKGTVNVSASRFHSILAAAGEVISSSPVTLSNGEPGVAKVHNFYKSNEYALVLGRATIYYNKSGQAVGFYDFYNFDPKAWGKRSPENEAKTRMVATAGYIQGATPFVIKYGLGIKH